jgi:hypothetical protein
LGAFKKFFDDWKNNVNGPSNGNSGGQIGGAIGALQGELDPWPSLVREMGSERALHQLIMDSYGVDGNFAPPGRAGICSFSGRHARARRSACSFLGARTSRPGRFYIDQGRCFLGQSRSYGLAWAPGITTPRGRLRLHACWLMLYWAHLMTRGRN